MNLKFFQWLLILTFLILLVGCGFNIDNSQQATMDEAARAEKVGPAATDVSEIVDDNQQGGMESKVNVEDVSTAECEDDSNCDNGLLCIDSRCGKIADLYRTNCEEKCSVKEVVITTSDGEEYVLPLGKGSYSYAGALEWKLMTIPAYCKGDQPLVPIKIVKKSTGKILAEQVITLKKSQTSDLITHPTIKKVQFTATLTEITEKC